MEGPMHKGILGTIVAIVATAIVTERMAPAMRPNHIKMSEVSMKEDLAPSL